MLRTIELILGLAPMSQHDAAATPMSNAFTDTPDFTSFTHRPAQVSFFETNPFGAPMQAEMETWDFSREDAAPDIAFNEAIWKSVERGGLRHAAPSTRHSCACGGRKRLRRRARSRSPGPAWSMLGASDGAAFPKGAGRRST